MKDKIRDLVEQLNTLSNHGKAELIQAFIESKRHKDSTIHPITIKDLAEIHLDAARIVTNMSMRLEIDKKRILDSTSHTQALAYSEAFYKYLRSKDFIDILISFGK